jgi:hypothetical protein
MEFVIPSSREDTTQIKRNLQLIAGLCSSDDLDCGPLDYATVVWLGITSSVEEPAASIFILKAETAVPLTCWYQLITLQCHNSGNHVTS